MVGGGKSKRQMSGAEPSRQQTNNEMINYYE